MKSYLYILIFILITNIASAKWQMTNGPGSNYVPCILIDSNEIYVVSGLGIYQSTNDGEKWNVINNKSINNFYEINGIIKENNSIYVGAWYGFFKTDDFGYNWEIINTGFPKKIFYIKKLLKAGNDIFALTYFDLYLFNEKEKKWYLPYDSIDITYNTRFSAVFCIDSTIYLGKTIEQTTNPPEANILISTDKGKNWKGIIDTISGISKCNISCFAIKGNLLFAGTNKGVFVSTDNGETWQQKNEGLFFKDLVTIYIIDNLIFAGTSSGMFYSTDYGDSWSLRSNGLTDINIRSIESYESKIFAGTARGLFITTDYGESWKSISSGLSGGLVWDITQDKGNLFAGNHDQGINITSDGGDNWSTFSQKNKFSSIYKIAVKDSNIYAGLFMSGGLIYSNDFGKNWKNAKDENGLRNQRVNCFEIDEDRLFVGTWQGIFYSDDYGNSWQSLNPELEYYRITSLKTSGNNYIAGTYHNGIFISSDKGATWSSYSTSFTDITIKDILITDNGIFAGTHNPRDYKNPKPYKGIFKSTDFGKTWIQVNNGLPENGINCLASYGNNIFVGFEEEGIYLSTNNGDSWSNISLGLTNFSIKKLLIINDEIYAASICGVYKAKLSDFGITDVKESEIQNYLYCYPPYPNPSTNIARSLIYWDTSLDIEDDDISVYDIYGTKIVGKEKIKIDKQNEYSGILSWDCTNVVNGIYLIRIIHGTKTWTLKVIVSK